MALDTFGKMPVIGTLEVGLWVWIARLSARRSSGGHFFGVAAMGLPVLGVFALIDETKRGVKRGSRPGDPCNSWWKLEPSQVWTCMKKESDELPSEDLRLAGMLMLGETGMRPHKRVLRGGILVASGLLCAIAARTMIRHETEREALAAAAPPPVSAASDE